MISTEKSCFVSLCFKAFCDTLEEPMTSIRRQEHLNGVAARFGAQNLVLAQSRFARGQNQRVQRAGRHGNMAFDRGAVEQQAGVAV